MYKKSTLVLTAGNLLLLVPYYHINFTHLSSLLCVRKHIHLSSFSSLITYI